MANNNVQNVRFLRNGTLFESRDAAKAALEAKTFTVDQDGSVILARYQETGEDVKTLAGYIYATASESSITIFDIDDAGADVDEKIQEIKNILGTGVSSANTVSSQLSTLSGTSSDSSAATSVEGAKKYAKEYTDAEIDNLDYSDNAVSGEYVSQVTEANGIIAVTRVALPTVAAISEAGKPITAVSESLGAISATAGSINAQYVDVSYSAITATDVKGALAEIADEIDAMDKSADVIAGQVVTTVSEADGKVSETKANIKDLQLGGYIKDTTATGDIGSTDTINAALSKLENKAAAITIANADHSINVTTAASGTDIAVNIKSGEKVISLGDNGIYTDIKLSAVTVSEANVKEAFALIASNGTTQLGSTIKIYKDSSLLSVALLHADTTANPQVLPTYDKVNGWTDIAETAQTQANQALCFAYENVEGTVVVAAVPVGSFINEQEFASGLTWDATAGKVKGVVDSNSESFLTVGEGGFKLAGVQDAIDAKVNALDVTGDTAQSGKYITHINEENGLIYIGGRADISKAPLNDYSKGSDATAVAASDTINQAISKLENQIDTAKSAATTVVAEGTDAGNNLSIGEQTAVDGHKTYTINLIDVASAQGLANEIEARKAVDGQNGQTYAANTSSPYISNATSLNDADVKLASALKSLSDDTINQVKVNGVALTEENNAVNAQISAAAGTGAETAAIAVNTNESTGAVTISLLGLDCGTY